MALGPLGRTRMTGDTTGVEVPALVVDGIARPREGEHLERLIDQRVAFVEVDAQREELGLLVARAHPQLDPATREDIE